MVCYDVNYSDMVTLILLSRMLLQRKKNTCVYRSFSIDGVTNKNPSNICPCLCLLVCSNDYNVFSNTWVWISATGSWDKSCVNKNQIKIIFSVSTIKLWARLTWIYARPKVSDRKRMSCISFVYSDSNKLNLSSVSICTLKDWLTIKYC